jgi:hypothetical protein
VLAGCAGEGGSGGGQTPPKRPACTPPQTPSVFYASNIQPIWNKGCVVTGCHLGPTAVNQLDLSAAQSYRQTVNQPVLQAPGSKRIVPGKPDQSYVLLKIINDPSKTGDIMPPGCPGQAQGGAQCLTPDEVQAIRTWITECAVNN